ncbi:MAG: OmpA family protein [Coxiellaceae bacterium]|nr:OmpA family protein [Coxiellaceae bacterium]
MNKHGIAYSFKAITLALFFAAALTSCNKEPDYIRTAKVSNLTSLQINEIYLLEKTGIQVFKQGLRFTFIIPVDCFFVKDTRELKAHRANDMDLLSNFIRSYLRYFDHPTVTITGYTDTVLLSPARDKLSLHYANTIASYLQVDGVPDETLVIRGKGASDPIASNAYPMGSSFNRRVVIEIH